MRKATQLGLEKEQTAQLRAAMACPQFREAFVGFLDEFAIDRTAWPALQEITWNRADRWIPANEVLALYERNWRHVDTAQLSPDEAALIRRLVDRFGNGVFNGGDYEFQSLPRGRVAPTG